MGEEPGSYLLPRDRTKINGHKLKYGKLHKNIRKSFLAVRVLRHWNRLPSETAESPSWEVIKTQTDMVPSNLFLLTLL